MREITGDSGKDVTAYSLKMGDSIVCTYEC